MSDSEQAAAPESGIAEDDPEILALLDFEPVPRKVNRGDGWTAELQRRFVANVAATGSRTRAAEALGREVAGASKLCRSPGGESFSAACDAALDLYQRRQDEEAARNPGRAWGEPLRSRSGGAAAGPLPGQVLNAFGEWEDEDSLQRRAELARDNITRKLLNARRLYLQEICGCAGKRAAFEILTELPIDWEKAKDLEEQPDEPYHRGRMRKPDMLLTAENGWLGDMTHGPDKKAELQKAVDEYLAEQGLPPVDWDDE